MGRIHSLFSVVVFFLVMVISGAQAADAPACSASFYDDAHLMAALPPELVPFVESARFRTIVSGRAAEWTTFHQSMDYGLAHLGHGFSGDVGGSRVWMTFRKTSKGDLELWIHNFTGYASHATPFQSGMQFLDTVAAELDWVAKARAAGTLKGPISIIGADFTNARVIDMLTGIGFKRSRFPNLTCYLAGIGGGLVGYVGGRIFFASVDANDQNGAIEEERRKYIRDISVGSLAGAGTAVGLMCFRKTGRNYSIEVNPDQVPPPPDQLPPGNTPPIDQPPPPNDPVQTAPVATTPAAPTTDPVQPAPIPAPTP
jgi:hypothetical protein